jgi:hypothetical protein
MIVGIVTVYNDRDNLLPHFMRHYAKLGVERLFVLVNTAENKGLIARARRLARRVPCVEVVEVSYAEFFSDEQKDAGERRVLDVAEIGENDWVLNLDLDEFHQYPYPLAEICTAERAAGSYAIGGNVLDRVACDGRLHAVTIQPCLGFQFPMGGDITGKVMRLCNWKYMLVRGSVRLQHGRHSIGSRHTRSIPVLGLQEQYRVHHFRYTRDLARRIETLKLHRTKELHLHVQGLLRFAKILEADRVRECTNFEYAGFLVYP